ncbi:MAG TPA: Dabb family protein [Patescibacteria group bacterium]|nr:Dabb family protein [Patescibacteria group bacterium]
MNVHIALYKWKDGVTAGEIRQAMLEIEALASKIPGIVEISTAENASKYSEGYTHVILVRGESQAAIDAYRAHPDHSAAAQKIDVMEEHGIGVDFKT